MKEQKIKVAPSILSADFRYLEKEVKAAEDAGADMIHCDIMDGCFVPNISFGPVVVESVKKCSTLPLDVHLMIDHPEQYITQFYNAGADILTVHAEACKDIQAVISQIKTYKCKVGITVNPDKPVDIFLTYLDQIDIVLIMSVFAGFSGQKFMPEVVSKIQTVSEEFKKIHHSSELEIDGGINEENAYMCALYGATSFVAGSFVFNSTNYQQRIEAVRRGAQRGIAEYLRN